MRVVSYNIYEGGTGRADPLAEILLAQDADVIALVEADDSVVLERIAKRIKMDYVVAPGRGVVGGTFDQAMPPHTVALFSRYEIDSSINDALVDDAAPNCMLRARLRHATLGRVTVGVVHCHPRATPSDEAIRVGQIRKLQQILEPVRKSDTPHLVMGDFNAISPIARINPDALSTKTRERFDANGNELPREAIGAMLNAGYADTLSSVAGESVAGRAATFSTLHRALRVDYIFSYGIDEQRMVGAWVEEDRLASYASDHYPIGVEISD